MVPKIQATVDAREKKIADDLEARAGRARAADETEAAWRARMDAARAEAAQLAQEAKQASARETEAKVSAAADKINLKVEAAEAQDPRRGRSRRARRSRPSRPKLTQDMVARLTGIKVDKKEAADAVKAELNV